MWLHRLVCEDVVNLERLLLEVSCEIIPDVTQSHLGDLGERGQRTLVLARLLKYLALLLG